MTKPAAIAVLALSLSAPLTASEGAAYLKIPQGAASTAMGAAMAARRGVEALWYTPAGLAGQDSLELALSRNAWLGQTRNDYVAAAMPVGPGGLGLWANYVGSEDAYRDAQGVDQGSFGVYNLSGGVAYGWSMGPLALGFGGKYFQERVELLQSANWAADAGAQLELWTPKVRLGLAAQNLGPAMNYDSSLGEVRAPATYRAGLVLERLGGYFTLSQELRLLPESGETSYLAGLELSAKAGPLALAGRAGYDTSAQVLSSGLAGFTVGAGAVMGPLHVDFALVPYGQLGNPYRMSVGWQFGPGAAPKTAAVKAPVAKLQATPAPTPLRTLEPQVQPAPMPDLRSPGLAPAGFDSAQAAWNAAKAAEAEGALEKARAAYTAGTQLAPDNFESWGRLAKFEYTQGNKAAAVAAFTRMDELRPNAEFHQWLEGYKVAP